MRKTENNVTIRGKVFNHHLVKRVAGPTAKNPGQPFIAGTLEIAVSPEAMQTVRVNFSYVTPTFKSGAENETYTILSRIIDDNEVYTSVGKNALSVNIDASFETNVYKRMKTGEIVVGTQIAGSFVNIIPPANFDAKFRADMVIHSAQLREFNNGGDIFELRGYVFNWKQNLVPITLTVPGEDGRKYFEDQTYPFFTKLWGNIENETIVTGQVKAGSASAFGTPQVKSIERQMVRWNVTGSSTTPYEYDDESSITKEEMRKKILDHETFIAQQTERLNNAAKAPRPQAAQTLVTPAAPKVQEEQQTPWDEFDF